MSLLIRPMTKTDIADIDERFTEQGWPARTVVLRRYLREQSSGQRNVFVAEVEGQVAGYVTLLPLALAGPFIDQLPEISDFNVFEKYQRHGVGSALLDATENMAAHQSSAVSLGVGLHAGYGPAQRLYIKRGYVPDGSGVWYQDRPLPMNATSLNNDDLVLYLSKELKKSTS
ncbi:GNAT family N-acetyltransferase [Schleiferilactobacillus perolens]|uniref:GNAT family N-acetyltransferase n=1 Tax=Schleiferilactobacillus perolens TaxID=100468 RepID=UPI002353F62C|nr:GNAT family N-acetyltransferase [Schleiferilactobacillus perolens]MCI2171548.1 GNAT family N-acetyltransferase [Schleiferilactobacillus perolens]